MKQALLVQWIGRRPTKPQMEVRVFRRVPWSLGRDGLCAGLKILRTRSKSSRFHQKHGVCSSDGRAPGCGSGGQGFDSLQTHQWGYSSAAEQRTVNPWAGGSNPSIPATERKHGREAEGTSLLTMRAGDRPGGSNPPASARRSDGEAVNAPVCKTGIRRSESGSELRTLSWLNR